MTADRLVPRRRGQDQRKPTNSVVTLPLVGRVGAKRRGGGRYEARASRHNNDPRPPTPPHKGKGSAPSSSPVRWPLPCAQRGFQRGAARGVVEVGVVVGQRLRALHVQRREYRPLLLEHVAGLLLEIGKLRKFVH